MPLFRLVWAYLLVLEGLMILPFNKYLCTVHGKMGTVTNNLLQEEYALSIRFHI